MQPERFDIVISGAGFAGVALALALRQAADDALTVAVLDRAKPGAATADLRAFAISAGSVHLLQTLGIWPLIESEAQPVTAINITGGKLESPIRQTLLSYDNHTEFGEPASYIVPAARLRDALMVTAQAAGLVIIPETVPSQLTVTTAGIEIVCAGGQTFSAQLGVASDGRRSSLRDLAGIKTVGWTYPQTAIITTVAHSEPHNGVATQHFLEAGPFAILPLTGGHRSSLVWTEATAEAIRVMALNDADFLAALEQRFGGILGTLHLDGPRAAQPLDMHLSRSLASERVAVIGDAARGVHPIAGQGLNLALRDVAALTETIIDTARLGLDIGAPEAMHRYERWRRFDGAMSAAAMDGLNRLFSNDNPALRAAREAGLGLTDRLPGLKNFFVAEAAGLTGAVPKLLAGELP